MSNPIVKRLGPFTYKATFDSMPDYVDGSSIPAGACTTFVRGGKTYRSFDLMYNNVAEFIVKTSEFDGVALIQGLNDGDLDYEKINQLPYHLADGRNKQGIIVTEHVLFNDMNFQGTGTKENDLTKLPTVILQNIHSIDELLTNAVVSTFLANAKIPASLVGMGFALHFIVTDNTTVYNISPKVDGSGYEIIDISSLPKLANFKWVNKATLERNDSDLQDRPTGIERWNLIDENTELSDLRFTKCYEESVRLSEFIGARETTKDSTDEELLEIYNTAHTAYINRTREDEEPTWQSLHAVVYGANGMEHLWTQENYEKDYIEEEKSMINPRMTSKGNYWCTEAEFTAGVSCVSQDDVELRVLSDDMTEELEKYISYNGTWVKKKVDEGGGGGDSKYPQGTVTNTACGALPAGSDISSKTTLEVQKMMVIKDLAPSVVINSVGGYTQKVFERGDSIVNPVIKAKITKADSAIKSIKFYVGTTLIDEITDGVALGGNFETTYSGTISTDTSIKVIADDQTNSGNATSELKFVDASYFGVLSTNTPTETDITNLTKKLAVSKSLVETFTANKEYTCWCYPKSYGALTKITDVAGGYPLIDTYNRLEITIDGVLMYCYVDIDKATVNNFKISFE